MAGGEMDDRRPTALRARPPRGAHTSRAQALRDPVVGRVVVAIRDSEDELDAESRAGGRSRCAVVGRDGNRQRTGGAMRKPWPAGIENGSAGLSRHLALRTMADVGAGLRG